MPYWYVGVGVLTLLFLWAVLYDLMPKKATNLEVWLIFFAVAPVAAGLWPLLFLFPVAILLRRMRWGT